MRSALAPLAAALVLADLPPAQETQVRTVQITDSIHMLVGRGGNLGLSAGADGAFLIDDQYADMAPPIRAAVAAITGQPVKFLINTHWHGDHTGGNEIFGQGGAIIVAHENVRERMSAPQFQEALSRNTPAAPDAALPIVTFTDVVTFHWNGDEIRVFHVDDAHTDGDSIIHFVGANVFHTGDVFQQRRYPFIDLDSGGDFEGIIAATQKLLEMVDDNSKIIPGHGELSTRQDLQDYVGVMTTVRDRVVELIEQGKSEDEVVAANPTVEFDPAWGQGFMNPETWTRLVYKSLKRDR